VKDPKTAEALTPKDHPIGTKRLCVDTDYFETYNRPNVTLVDMRESRSRPSRRPACARRRGTSSSTALVFATGFDAMTGALLAVDIAAAAAGAQGRLGGAGRDLSRPDRRRASPTCSRSPVPAARRCSTT
jgi:cation diffusion facilitator CzcD-associated flavoprotein CzcO